ncbi:MAG: peptidase m10a and m12b matrixin and adamalysin [Ferruginibacter sp.]|nr:peptidase m10a and m12b matrixin and adamalysin [Ferruginibacter sp.]
MGEAEINTARNQLIIRSAFFFYGDAANEELSRQVAKDIADHWNEANGKVIFKNRLYDVFFEVTGEWAKDLRPEDVFENTNPRNNYFRIESYAGTDISFVDGIGSNTGYFKLDNLLNNSTTAAHEYGHTIGLQHPKILDIRGKGRPGIMYPRGTIVDGPYQYNPAAAPLEPGGTMNPFTRKVLQEDIDNLRLSKLSFNRYGFAVVGEFSSQWHEKHLP